jgi:hypothetical protein
MEKTDALIASLVQTAMPAKRTAHPGTMFAWWLVGCLAYIVLVLCFMGVRDDIAAKLHAPEFIGELAILLCIMMSAALSAVVLSFPDMFQKRWFAYSPLAPLAAFIGMLGYQWMNEPVTTIAPPSGEECLLCITLLSLLPGACLLYMLRKLAGVHYYVSGAIALIAASSVGCITLRLSEKTDSMHHLVEWHYMPMIGFGIIGVLLGRNLLKW